VPLAHHDLCFGCGLANLFGLQLEVEAEPGGERVSGRFFVKQDHQGPPGFAHGGVIVTALDEAMALLVHGQGTHAVTRRLEVDLLGPVPVGSFATVEAWVESRGEKQLDLRAELRGEQSGGRPLARASGSFAALAIRRGPG
jgi:acyl-coenzyme A thioesterase PaaI-like protein